jgi:hypothetical protein
MNLDSSAGDAEIGRLMLEALKAYNAGREDEAYAIAKQIQLIRASCPDCKL